MLFRKFKIIEYRGTNEFVRLEPKYIICMEFFNIVTFVCYLKESDGMLISFPNYSTALKTFLLSDTRPRINKGATKEYYSLVWKMFKYKLANSRIIKKISKKFEDESWLMLVSDLEIVHALKTIVTFADIHTLSESRPELFF